MLNYVLSKRKIWIQLHLSDNLAPTIRSQSFSPLHHRRDHAGEDQAGDDDARLRVRARPVPAVGADQDGGSTGRKAACEVGTDLDLGTH